MKETEFLEAFLKLLTKAPPGGAVQNLVNFRAAMYLRKLAPEARVEMGRLIRDLLRGPGDVFERLDRFSPASLKLLNTVGTVGPATVRNLASILLMLDDPERNIFVRIDTFNSVSTALTGGKLIGHGVKPDGAEYRRVLDLAQRVRKELTDRGWPPKDLIDVQSFIWVTGGGYDGEAGIGPATTCTELVPATTVPTTNLILYGPPGTGNTKSH